MYYNLCKFAATLFRFKSTFTKYVESFVCICMCVYLYVYIMYVYVVLCAQMRMLIFSKGQSVKARTTSNRPALDR